MQSLHPELSSQVIRVDAEDPFKGLLEKASMFERSPFDETLYLDVDTVVLERLDFAFAKAQKFGVACAICECPWARRYGGLQGEGDIVEYNTGVLFFTKGARPLFDAWARLAPKIDSSMLLPSPPGEKHIMPYNDQCAFAAAVEETGFLPFVLPLNWNFRPQCQLSFFGPLKIWHDYAEVPAFFDQARTYYAKRDAIIRYHAANR